MNNKYARTTIATSTSICEDSDIPLRCNKSNVNFQNEKPTCEVSPSKSGMMSAVSSYIKLMRSLFRFAS